MLKVDGEVKFLELFCENGIGGKTNRSVVRSVDNTISYAVQLLQYE